VILGHCALCKYIIEILKSYCSLVGQTRPLLTMLIYYYGVLKTFDKIYIVEDFGQICQI